MPIDITNTLTNGGNWTFMSKGLSRLFGSRIYTTAILTLMIIILIMIMYPCKLNTPTWILLKLGFYIFLVSISVIFMHDCVILNAEGIKKGGDDEDEVINSITRGGDDVAFSSEKVEVKPDDVPHDKTYGGSQYESVGGDADEIFGMYGV
jgi:hypothetical protein